MRNHLLDQGIDIDGLGSIISAADFREILTRCLGELNIHPKLTEHHINCTGSQRQRVRLAAQLLSHTSATAMRCLSHGKAAQSNFVDLINDWFDVVNSRMKYSKKKLECGYGIHLAEQSSVLRKMVETAEKMRCVGKRTSNTPFQRGLIITSKSLLRLYEVLSERYGVEFILTSHLNQDCVENLFSRIRAVGGSYSHPTSVDFIYRLKKLIVGRASDLVIKTAAVEMEKDTRKSAKSGILTQILTSGIENHAENQQSKS